MSHEETQILLSAYLDGETRPEETALVERHLSTCERCQAELEALRETVGVLAGLREVEAPGDFVEQVQGTIRRRSLGRYYPDRDRSGSPPGWDALAVVMLLVLASVAVTLLPSPPPSIPRIAGEAGHGGAAGAAERSAFRVLAAGLDPAVVRRLAGEAGATRVRELPGGGLEIRLPAGAAQRLVDQLNEAAPLEVERGGPPDEGDRVVVHY